MRTKRDPNRLNVDDYFSLTLRDRTRLDDWLTSLGGHPTKTKELILDTIAKTVTAIEYLFDSESKVYTARTIIGEVEISYAYEEGPPVWVY